MGGQKSSIYPSALGADYNPLRDVSPVGGGYAPGPLGVDTDGTPSEPVAPIQLQDRPKGPVGAEVLTKAQAKSGKKVGDGECFALVDKALHEAGAKSAADFGTVAPEADYVWGTEVSTPQPGDVLQFRKYRFDRTIDSDARTDTDFGERPHHSAIVVSVDGDKVTVIEQNAPEKGAAVGSHVLFLKDMEEKSGDTTTTIKVTGTIKIYRPQRS